jgi:DNA-binding LacI/PurR family transcriptional regulator
MPKLGKNGSRSFPHNNLANFTPVTPMSPKSSNRYVTLEDIAQSLGVSRTTVAMALKDSHRIAKSTRERVQKAAKEMRYEPNPMATSLARFRQKSKAQPIRAALAWLNLWPDPKQLRGYHDFDEYWKGAYACAENFGFRLDEFVWDSRKPLKQLEQVLIARGISGILLPPHQYEADWESFPWEKYSVVRLSRSEKMPEMHTVTADHVGNAIAAFDAISARGYNRIGFFTAQAPAERKWLHEAGFLKAQLGVNPSNRVALLQDSSLNQEKFTRWLREERPDAILTPCLETSQMLRQAGYRIPEDIGLASMSFLDGNSDAGVNQNPQEIGRVATLVLLSLLQDNHRGIPQIQREILIKGTWVDGKSLPTRSRTDESNAQVKLAATPKISTLSLGSHEAYRQMMPNHAFFATSNVCTTFA